MSCNDKRGAGKLKQVSISLKSQNTCHFGPVPVLTDHFWGEASRSCESCPELPHPTRVGHWKIVHQISSFLLGLESSGLEISCSTCLLGFTTEIIKLPINPAGLFHAKVPINIGTQVAGAGFTPQAELRGLKAFSHIYKNPWEFAKSFEGRFCFSSCPKHFFYCCLPTSHLSKWMEPKPFQIPLFSQNKAEAVCASGIYAQSRI